MNNPSNSDQNRRFDSPKAKRTDNATHGQTADQPPVLTINQVRKTYPNGTEALKGVSFEIRPGEFVAVIGSSGSGKSTLLRLINQLVPQTGGSIRFKGKAVERLRGAALKQVRREIGMIFQHYNLIDRLTVFQNVLHGRLGYMNDFCGVFDLYSREDRQAAWDILCQLGLEAEIYKRANQLSGGQKQRVGIARALAQKPSLMLADEPIASLDPVSSRAVMDTLRDICREDGIPMLVSLHQINYALEYASRIIGIRHGVVVFDGLPSAVGDEEIRAIYGSLEAARASNHQTTEPVTFPQGLSGRAAERAAS